MPHHRVIVVDSRGHGRSTRDTRHYGYDLMADDIIALLDKLEIPVADIVGWSDGGILSLDLAMRYPARIRRVFAFAANTRPDGLIPNGSDSPVFAAFIKRAGDEYRQPVLHSAAVRRLRRPDHAHVGQRSPTGPTRNCTPSVPASWWPMETTTR